MSRNRNNAKTKTRAEPTNKTISWLVNDDAFEVLTCQGYTSLAQNPEVISGVNKIARLVGSMTIHLMANGENGDIRIKNALSRKIDVNPFSKTTRSNFIQWIVKTMYIGGNGNAIVYPKFEDGFLDDLKPVPPSMVSFTADDIWNYKVSINGKLYEPDSILHFVLNPDETYPWKGTGVRAALSQVANDLKQAATTKKKFMESKWKPSVIVKVDALTEEFSSPEGRRKLLSDYIDTGDAGEPWLIPADQFSVEQIRPLSLSDLALSDMVQLDKKTVAAILEIPPFVLGVGDFKREEWNNFISSTVMPIAQTIQQEMTKKLLYSDEMFFRFNPRSLYSYELRDLAAIADDQYIRGIMTGNEVRDWIGLSPLDGLNDLIILENYIPRGMIGDQNKLKGGEE